MNFSLAEVQARIQSRILDPLDAHLRAKADKRQERAYSIGAWNAGACPRSLWLQLNGEKGEPLQPRALLTFDLGDRVEDSLMEFLIAAGAPIIRTDRRADTFDLAGGVGRGRMDAWADLGDDLRVPCDAKSMSTKSWERIVEVSEGGLNREPTDEDRLAALEADIFASKYLAQLELYMRDPSLGAEWGVLFLVKKETFHVHMLPVPRCDKRWAEVQRNVALAKGTTIPDRPHALRVSCFDAPAKCVDGKTPIRGSEHKACGGTGRCPNAPLLPIVCSYCPVKEACWGPLEQGTWKTGKPWWRPRSTPADARFE